MQCMEVWGGNEAVDNRVTMAGLDVWVVSRPYKGDAGGGDIHYLSSCATGRITRLLVADVSGHGSAVAGLAVRLRNLMRRYVNYIDQRRFFSALNREFALAAEATGAFGFATAVVATYWAPTEDLSVSNAGHPPPLWYRAADGTWEFLKGARRAGDPVDRGDAGAAGPMDLPLGVLEPTQYEQFDVKLAPRDLLLIYTDSLVESHAHGGEQLGEAGLLEVVRTLDPTQPESLVARLLDKVCEYRAGTAADDDETALLLRQNAIPPKRASVAGGLAAGWRYLGIALSMLRGRDKDPFPWPELTAANFLGAFWARFNSRKPQRRA